jgi:Zn-dependent protease
VSTAGLRFSSTELRDLVAAWLALGVAFAIFFAPGGGDAFVSQLLGGGGVSLLVVSLLTAGVGFLLHELGHKVVAVKFGQIAEFRADYGMLFLAIMSAFVGFLFAAPGAVHHRGMLTEREHGLIALAGPAVNLALAVVFIPIAALGIAGGWTLLWEIGSKGTAVNLFLAAFNLIPFASLDGRTVIGWSKVVWALTFFPSVAFALLAILFVPF